MFDNEEIDVNDIVVPGFVNLPINKSSSGITSHEEDTNYENVFQVAQEAFSGILRKLNQLEIEYKGLKDEELLLLMKNYQEQKQNIFEELDTMKGSDLSLIKLHTLVRTFYINLLAWEELLFEHFTSQKKKKIANPSLTSSSNTISSLSTSSKPVPPTVPISSDPDLSTSPVVQSKQLTVETSLADSPSSLSSPFVSASSSGFIYVLSFHF